MENVHNVLAVRPLFFVKTSLLVEGDGETFHDLKLTERKHLIVADFTMKIS